MILITGATGMFGSRVLRETLTPDELTESPTKAPSRALVPTSHHHPPREPTPSRIPPFRFLLRFPRRLSRIFPPYSYGSPTTLS